MGWIRREEEGGGVELRSCAWWSRGGGVVVAWWWRGGGAAWCGVGRGRAVRCWVWRLMWYRSPAYRGALLDVLNSEVHLAVLHLGAHHLRWHGTIW